MNEKPNERHDLVPEASTAGEGEQANVEITDVTNGDLAKVEGGTGKVFTLKNGHQLIIGGGGGSNVIGGRSAY